MITLATFTTPEEAHLLRSRLESAGIPAFLHSEYAVQNLWIHSNLLGGVRVQIAESDLEAAREFLSADPLPLPLEAVEVPCPACGSMRTAPDPGPRRRSLFLLVLLNLPWPFSRRRWKCEDCGHPFKVKPSGPN
jgi:Putative prokaryotic signal transducing protein